MSRLKVRANDRFSGFRDNRFAAAGGGGGGSSYTPDFWYPMNDYSSGIIETGLAASDAMGGGNFLATDAAFDNNTWTWQSDSNGFTGNYIQETTSNSFLFEANNATPTYASDQVSRTVNGGDAWTFFYRFKGGLTAGNSSNVRWFSSNWYNIYDNDSGSEGGTSGKLALAGIDKTGPSGTAKIVEFSSIDRDASTILTVAASYDGDSTYAFSCNGVGPDTTLVERYGGKDSRTFNCRVKSIFGNPQFYQGYGGYIGTALDQAALDDITANWYDVLPSL